MPQRRKYANDNEKQAAYRERVRKKEAELERLRRKEHQRLCLHRWVTSLRHVERNQYVGHCGECGADVFFYYSGMKVEP